MSPSKLPSLSPCLCLVTDRGFRPSSEFLRTVETALNNGVTMVQLREKTTGLGGKALCDRDYYRLGCQVMELTKSKGASLIVNDRLDLAMAIGADGVHLGQGDLPVAVARSVWPGEHWFGVSVSTLEEAKQAESGGANYLGVGAVFPTDTKLDAPSAGLAVLRQICQGSGLPVIAIGGISLKNADQVMRAGSAGIAVVSAIWGASDPARASADLAAMVRQNQS